MDRSSPQATFLTAQQAIAHGDWETFFACLTADDLKRLAGIGVNCVIGPGAEQVVALCAQQGVPDEAIAAVRDVHQQLERSAAAMTGAAALAQAEMLDRSLRHRDLVKAHDAAVQTCVKRIRDLAGFVAAIERHRRTISGGGSVSSSMFAGETLGDVVVTGSKAVGVRQRRRPESDEPVGFVQTRGNWQVKLFGRPLRSSTSVAT